MSYVYLVQQPNSMHMVVVYSTGQPCDPAGHASVSLPGRSQDRG